LFEFILIIQEFKELMFGHIHEGSFSSHAEGSLCNTKFLELRGLRDKRTNLSFSNNTLFGDNQGRRVACYDNDPLSCAVWLDKVKAMSGPGQETVFCRPATKLCKLYFDKGMKKGYDAFHGDMLLDPERPMSMRTIASFAPKLCKWIGIENASEVSNHEFRAWGISNAVNRPNANALSVLRHSRHQNASSQLPYQRMTATSNDNFQRAINSMDSTALQTTHSNSKKSPPLEATRELARPVSSSLQVTHSSSKKPPPLEATRELACTVSSSLQVTHSSSKKSPPLEATRELARLAPHNGPGKQEEEEDYKLISLKRTAKHINSNSKTSKKQKSKNLIRKSCRIASNSNN
jgi:hypothetical protein